MKGEKEIQWIWGEKEKQKTKKQKTKKTTAPPCWLPTSLTGKVGPGWGITDNKNPWLKLWYFIILSSKQKPTVPKPRCHVPEAYHSSVCTAVVVTHLDQTSQAITHVSKVLMFSNLTLQCTPCHRHCLYSYELVNRKETGLWSQPS